MYEIGFIGAAIFLFIWILVWGRLIDKYPEDHS